MTLGNEFLSVKTDSSAGGRIISLFDKTAGRELLWYDASRVPADPELDYDGNFAGGMDELLPCDPPENGWPDHGELWTAQVNEKFTDNILETSVLLPLSGLEYKRTLRLAGNSVICNYEITNRSGKAVDFLWKLHGAFAAAAGDRLDVPAGCIQAADPGNWSKAADAMPRLWHNDYVLPAMDGSSDFFYLTDLASGKMAVDFAAGGRVECSFDPAVFAAAWVFASFGRLNGSRCIILEPCTNYPGTLAEAKQAKVCAHLEADEQLTTQVCWQIIN